MTPAITYRSVGRPIISWSAAAIADREVRADLRRRGVCTECRRRKTRGKALCPACRQKSTEHQKKLRHTRTVAGDCQQCGKPADFRARCPECVEKRNRRHSRQPAYRAAEHRDTKRRQRSRAAAWRKAGLCVDCGAARDPAGGRLCPEHRARNRASGRLSAEVAKGQRLADVAVFEARYGAVTVAQAAELVGVCTVRLCELCRGGVIPWGVLGALRRLHLYDVLAYKAVRDARPDRQRNRKARP